MIKQPSRKRWVWRRTAGLLALCAFGGCGRDIAEPRKPAEPAQQRNGYLVADSVPYSVDGHANAVRFGFPQGLAFDSKGNLYVADSRDHVVRVITPSRDVSTYAGSPGRPGHADGTGLAARFTVPLGIAVDRFDNVYVTDAGNETIRKISPAGEVSTLAGVDGQPGAVDGDRRQAMFDYPHGIAVDRNGTVYVTSRQTIRKISNDGTVRTLAGNPRATAPNPDPYADGIGLLARFSDPMGLASNDLNIFVADTGNVAIRKIDSNGWVTTLAGAASKMGHADGVGIKAEFERPEGVAVDSRGNVYVADCRGPMVRRVSPSGETATIGPNGCANGIAIDAAGAIYVSQGGIAPGVHRLGSILKILPSGEVSTYAGPEPDN